MKFHYKKKNIICFDSFDLKKLFEAPSRKKLLEEVLKSGYSPEELIGDQRKKEEVVEKVKIVTSKEEKEIFCALYMFPRFYPGESKICFVLKDGIDPQKESIDTLEKLKKSLKEEDLTDFLFLHNDGFRAYQLKAYLGKTEVNEFFEFLKKKLLHYSNDLGEINLLVIMQSQGAFTGNFFQEIHKRLETIGLKGTGHVLVSYNEENKFNVMNTVYPILGTTRIPLKLPSEQ